MAAVVVSTTGLRAVLAIARGVRRMIGVGEPDAGLAPPSAPAAPTTSRCVVVTSAEELEPHLQACDDLERRALDDNFYLSGRTLHASMRHLGPGRRDYVVLVYADCPGVERLVGIAAFTLESQSFGRPAVLSTFSTPHTYLSHPVLDRDAAESTVRALWDWIEAPAQPWSLVRLRHVTHQDRTWRRIHEELTRRGRALWVKSAHLRVALRRSGSYESFIESLPSRRRKTLRRQWRRLERIGEVDVKVHRAPSDPPALCRCFMDLEARSWKGGTRTALACQPSDAAFFQEITKQASARGRLLFVELLVGGRPIAMTANFVLGRTLFAFKVAYDPFLKEYSPGILAELETIRAFHDGELEWADGGTSSESYLDRIWRSSHPVREVYTSTGHPRADALLGAFMAGTSLKRLAGAGLNRMVDVARSMGIARRGLRQA